MEQRLNVDGVEFFVPSRFIDYSVVTAWEKFVSDIEESINKYSKLEGIIGLKIKENIIKLIYLSIFNH